MGELRQKTSTVHELRGVQSMGLHWPELPPSLELSSSNMRSQQTVQCRTLI